MLQNCEGVTIFNGYTNIKSAIEYQVNDILISNIRPYLKKIWLADKTGICSTDVLVLRAKNLNNNIKYIFQTLKQDQFFKYVMQSAKGLKMPRGDKKSILEYKIPVPPLAEQQKIVAEIDRYEQEIQKHKNTMQKSNAQKQEILTKYLNS